MNYIAVITAHFRCVPDAVPEPLRPETVVIRGGEVMNAEDLLTTMRAHREQRVRGGGHAGFWLSVNAVPGLTVDEVAKRAARPNSKIRVSAVQTIEAAGWIVTETPGRRNRDGHCDVYLPDDLTEPAQAELDRLVRAFSAPIKNEGKPMRGARK